MPVMTVNGLIEKSALGIVMPHEHIFLDLSVFYTEPKNIGDKNIARGPVTMDKLGLLKRNPFAVLDNLQMTDETTQVEELFFLKSAGCNTVVDATCIGMGRDPRLLAMASAKTGLNIVVGSGFYVEGALDAETLDLSEKSIEDLIVKEIESGIGHSGIRAGIIGEIGVSHLMYPFEEKSLRAACRAQTRTGAPLLIHINPWSTQGLNVIEIVNEYKIPVEKVTICHVDVENNEDYIFKLLGAGVFIEFDNFGKEMFMDIWDCKPGSGRFVTDWQRVLLIKKLIDHGFEKQLLFSCDVCLKSLLRAYGGWGYDHVLQHIIPMLEEVGIKPEKIQSILTENPARWLDC